MAARRKGPRKRQRNESTQTLATATSIALVIFTLCLCAFNFDLNGETTTTRKHSTHPRLEKCRTTCDKRLQSAALESHVPSSASPSAFDALFQLGDVADSHSTFQGRVGQPSSSNGNNHKANPATKQPMQARPRRLPTLIKILTGFGDEHDSTHDHGPRPIIARVERPDFIPQAQPRHSTTDPLSHEETVQIAAAAAAAAVFSRSIRIFGNNRMHRVNSEWDAALRWIAGWDQPQQQQGSSSLGGGDSSESIRAKEGSANGGAENVASQEGYNTFVDDLARMLESCISQCVEDDQFEARLENDGRGPIDGLSVGNMVFKSIFGWIVASSFPNFPRISFGKLGIISSESMFMLCRTVQFIGSSLAVYALHSLWVLVSPSVFEWYSSLGYKETPEWLLEHEKEIQMAKNSRSRQKKKSRRKQSVKQAVSRSKMTPQKDVVHKERHVDTIIPKDDLRPNRSTSHTESAPDSAKVEGKVSDSSNTSVNELEQMNADFALPDSKDSLSGSQDSSEGIPSVISYSSTSASLSASSSPSLKPLGHSVDDDIPFGASLQGPDFNSQLGRHSPLFALNTQLRRHTPLFSRIPHGRALPVPTQEQRNEAAKQLREFQNAQIQRLLLQRKLSQISNESRLSATSPLGHGLISGSSYQTTRTASAVTGQGLKELRPPPGLVPPSEVQHYPVLQNQDDKAFLTDNELFLSKLLDDDDDDTVEVSSSLQIGIESMSPESSLDPSAAPFVSTGKVSSTDKCRFPLKPKEKMGDVWLSNPNELLKGKSPAKIKGVYGGSVW
eukprot:CAMPEP_0196141640 /NCGR_PEP_ID=MMETSP0910-20130528/10084_1 /TAXON_ID=49265 /ORGANISM="Thalassiosira rotula, Strain GSO102" /LENGTH=784 /DNA_ID=CAMNT_0041402821 /DNA_START=30 /DNA_END=2384 /DNA_ORIENTATION=+